MMRIGYTDDPVTEYGKGLNACATLRELQMTVAHYRRIAADAVTAADEMTEGDMPVFRAGLKLERKGKFAGEPWMERFGCIVMPEIMFRVTMVANQFKVPWGLAFIRCKEQGLIVEGGGVTSWREPSTGAQG